MNWKPRYLLLGLLGGFCSGLLGAETNATRQVQERPRVFRGPYNEAVLGNQYYSTSMFGYRGYYSPFYSPLMFLGPVMPGRSMVSFAAGSDGYIGTAFSTSDFIEGTNLLYSLSASWEQGETWFGQDYQLSTISPSLSWSNGTTSIFLGFEMSELSMDSAPVVPRARPRVDTDPLRSSIPLTRDRNPTMEFESLNAGLSQRIGDSMQVFLSVGEDAFRGDDLSMGLSHQLWDNPYSSRR
jgi:hypothetical protein